MLSVEIEIKANLSFQLSYSISWSLSLAIIFMSNFRQFKPVAELCQAKTNIYVKLSHAEAANYAELSLLARAVGVAVGRR